MPITLLLSLLLAVGTACASAPATTPAAPAPAPETAEPSLLPLRYDASNGKVTLTVPRLGERLLYLNTHLHLKTCCSSLLCQAHHLSTRTAVNLF